jgi:hypothetical protein
MSYRAVTGVGLSGTPFPGYQGTRDLTGPTPGHPGLSAWPGRVARWVATVSLRAAVSPHRPPEPGPNFFEL